MVDAVAFSSAERQRLVALSRQDHARDDDDSEWSAPAAVASVSHSLKVADVPVAMQRQVPVIGTVQKMVEVPETQYLGRVADVPVETQQHMPMFQKVQRTVWRSRRCGSLTERLMYLS